MLILGVLFGFAVAGPSGHFTLAGKRAFESACARSGAVFQDGREMLLVFVLLAS
jgi:hypothetical protein